MMWIKEKIIFLWNSPTFTQLLNLITKPLRLFFLTPLIFTKFSLYEIDLFFILASCSSMGVAFTTTIPSVLMPVMVFYLSGGKDISQYGKSIKSRQIEYSEGRNLIGLADAFATAGLLQRYILLPLLVVLASILFYANGKQAGDFALTPELLVAGTMVLLTNGLDLYFSRYVAALRAMQKVALTNRVGVFFTSLAICVSAVVVLLGGGLIGAVITQFLVSLAKRFYFYKLLRTELPNLKEGAYSKEIIRAISKPLKKACVGALSYGALERLWPALVAGIVAKNDFAAFALGVGLSSTIKTAATANVVSQGPRLTRIYNEGNYKSLREDSSLRVLVSIGLLTIGLIVGGPLYAVFLNVVGSKVEFMNFSDWCAIGFLLVVAQFNGLLMFVYNVTNERPFYLRQLLGVLASVAGLVSISYFYPGTVSIPVAGALLFLPRTFFLGLSPSKKVSKLMGCGIFAYLFIGCKKAFEKVKGFVKV